MSGSETDTVSAARSGYRQRLEQVSRYYLAPPPDDTAPDTCVFMLPVLLDEQDNEFPLHAFTRALAARNQAATIIHSDNTPLPAYNGTDITVYLLTVTDPSHRLFLKCRQVLMTVPANAEGVQRGCLRLKQLVNINSQIRTGITMTHVSDQSRGRGYYDTLSAGAQAFLNHQPISLGSLLEPGTQYSDCLTPDAIPVGLAYIADRVISQWIHVSADPVSTTPVRIPNCISASGR